MSIWKVDGKVSDEQGNIVSNIAFTFEVQCRDYYSQKKNKVLAKIEATKCVEKFNLEYKLKKAKADFRTLRNVGSHYQIYFI